MAEAPEEIVDELYGAPFPEFVARRDAAARALRREKRREEADAVKSLRKPTLSAWAVNQLARSDRESLDALLASGAALRQARGGDVLRDATRDERAAVDELASSAMALLRQAGEKVSGKTLTEVRDTLHAAALDDEARDLIAAGRLVEPRQAIGLGGFGFGAAPRGAPASPEAPASREPAPKESSEGARKQAASAAAAASARRERVKAARSALRDAEGAVRERERDMRSADREVEQAERALADAEEALDAAQRAADAARDSLEEAREEVDRARSELDEAGG